MRDGSTIELIDANAILRYLIRDNAEHTRRAAELIESGRMLSVAVSTLAEVAFTLLRVYKLPRSRICDALIDLLERENIHPLEIDPELTLEAFRIARPSGRVSFADALLWAIAHDSAPARVWTFDKRFPTQGIDVQLL